MTTRDATRESLTIISTEIADLLAAVAATQTKALEEAVRLLTSAPRVFVLGAGRSGLALRMTAMRLMHLGMTVHVAGDTTTPAIGAGDVLLVASGSGTTPGIVRAATTAKAVGARVIAVTCAPESPVAQIAVGTIVIPAAQKLDRDGARSVQYAGSLFEQAVVLIGDALFHAAWQTSGQTADELWPRHANLE